MSTATSVAPRVATRLGVIAGLARGGIELFRGIPYAQSLIPARTACATSSSAPCPDRGRGEVARLSTEVRTAWTAFARGERPAAPGWPAWEPYCEGERGDPAPCRPDRPGE